MGDEAKTGSCPSVTGHRFSQWRNGLVNAYPMSPTLSI